MDLVYIDTSIALNSTDFSIAHFVELYIRKDPNKCPEEKNFCVKIGNYFFQIYHSKEANYVVLLLVSLVQ